MVDNFERAKTSLKTEAEGEEKIDNSYQGIYKQFVEFMKALGIVAVDTVDTVGKEFDPKVD
jgi:molecular chaperone GrpE